MTANMARQHQIDIIGISVKRTTIRVAARKVKDSSSFNISDSIDNSGTDWIHGLFLCEGEMVGGWRVNDKQRQNERSYIGEEW